MTVVALVGASGNFGQKVLPVFEADARITKIHSIARSRPAKPSASPKTTHLQADFADPHSLDSALQGCDVLVNVIGTNLDHMSSKGALVDAAVRARIKVYFPSEFGVDPHVDSEFIRHPMWDSKKAHDADAEKKGLKVIAVYNGLFMEHPHGGFQAFHGFFPEKETWYVPGDPDKPLTVTSKRDIAQALVELMVMALAHPDSVPNRIRLNGTSDSPRLIIQKFNKAAHGKTTIKLVPLTDEEASTFMNADTLRPPPGTPKDFDLNLIYSVATRVFRMAGKGENLDFSQRNDNDLVNPNESKWKWKTIDEYAEQVDGMPREEIAT